MTEEILKNYFEGLISEETLSAELVGSQKKTGYDTKAFFIEPIEGDDEFLVDRPHLIKLCQATIDGKLTPTDLNTIAFFLVASDYFTWEILDENGEIIDNTITDWDNPEIKHPLTNENLRLWKKYLETGEYNLNS